MSDDLTARRDALGRGIVSERRIGRDIVSRPLTGTACNDLTVRARPDAGAHVTGPSRKDGERELTPRMYERYAAEIGHIGRPALADLVSSPERRTWGREEWQDAARDVMRYVRQEAKAVIDEQAPVDAGGAWTRSHDASRR